MKKKKTTKFFLKKPDPFLPIAPSLLKVQGTLANGIALYRNIKLVAREILASYLCSITVSLALSTLQIDLS